MLKFPIHNDVEARQYRAGQRVEVKNNPGVIDIIAEYNPMLVPPVILINDPHPRYPEELELVNNSIKAHNWLTKVNNMQQKLTLNV
jgi:hypothetical protein